MGKYTNRASHGAMACDAIDSCIFVHIRRTFYVLIIFLWWLILDVRYHRCYWIGCRTEILQYIFYSIYNICALGVATDPTINQCVEWRRHRRNRTKCLIENANHLPSMFFTFTCSIAHAQPQCCISNELHLMNHCHFRTIYFVITNVCILTTCKWNINIINN